MLEGTSIYDMCQCENMPHVVISVEEAQIMGIVTDTPILPTGHAYLAVPAGTRRAAYIGRVCDECAETCMKDYMMD